MKKIELDHISTDEQKWQIFLAMAKQLRNNGNGKKAVQ